MSSPIYMPKLGLTMTEGTLTEWLVNTGETVSQGQPVASIETDKIETEIEAETEGRLHQLSQSGEVFECGVVLGWVLEEGEEPPETPEVQKLHQIDLVDATVLQFQLLFQSLFCRSLLKQQVALDLQFLLC
jgi:pyruvate/2-oxoglutarate dehydrogenase complex dihydrolipoamide acyltransferase (E2) component